MQNNKSPMEQAREERWKRSFFTVDNREQIDRAQLKRRARMKAIEDSIAIYSRREHCPRRIFVAVMTLADLCNKDGVVYRVLRSSVMTRCR